MEVDVCWDAAAAEDEALMAWLAGVAEGLAEAPDRELSVMLTDDEGIRALNAQWRDEDKPTDVLSFPMDAPVGPFGDIVLSVPTATRQAAEHGWTLRQELTFLLVHGFAHLLGHDHGEPAQAAAMRAEEERLLARVAPGQRRPEGLPY
jgi:probable rRNA maturation factor